MAWIGHVRRGKAVDPEGKPIAGAQVCLLNAARRPIGTLPPTDTEGNFQATTTEEFPPDLHVFLAHPGYARAVVPLPQEADLSIELAPKSKGRTASESQMAGARSAVIERGPHDLAAVFEIRFDEQGHASVPSDPACTYRFLPFAELRGGFVSVTDQLHPGETPRLEDLASDLRYPDVVLVRKTDLETTYKTDNGHLLRFFYIPSSLDEAIALAPLLERHDQLRDGAFNLRHDNLCPTVRAGVKAGIGYLSYQVSGPSLAEIVNDRGPLSGEETRAVARDLGKVLPLFHDRGIGHGNIAPQFVHQGPEGYQLAPPCPAISIGERYDRTHHLAAGFEGDDIFLLGATLHYVATRRMPTWEEETISGPPDVAHMIEVRRHFKRPGTPLDDLLALLLDRNRRPSLDEALSLLT